MAGGASTEESEPLFVLEPLPELSGVIDTITAANPLLLLAGASAIVYLLAKVEDPMLKLSYTSLLALSLSFYVTDSLFYSMLFISVRVMTFFLVWSALRWDDVKAALGLDKARILSIISFIVSTWILVVLGTAIGCRFTGTKPAEVLRILKISIGSTFILMSTAVAGGLLIGELTGIPWYLVTLAYAPGGLAEMSLIAIGIGQDVPFVATHHLCRIGIIILFAPLAFRLISQYFLQKKKY